jgi:hypothetical protein
MIEYKTTWTGMPEHNRTETNYRLERGGTFQRYPDPEVPEGDGWELVGSPTFDDDYMIWTWRREVEPVPESEAESEPH